MNSSFGIKNRCKPKSRCGFALVTALSLMAFMLILVVTLLSLMEVETRSADNNLELQRAREGARLALSMAVGQLQEYAGNDERVTARADITGSAVTGADYWTGVWNSTSADTNPIAWLTSGTNPKPVDVLNDSNSLLLVDDGTLVDDDSDYRVRSPFTEILDKNGNATSRIAWWVSDEGVKASTTQLPLRQRLGGLGDANYPIAPPNFTPESSLHALQTIFSTSHGLEEIFSGYNPFNLQTTADAKKLNRIHYLEQLFSLDEFDENWISTTEEAFHSLTTMSMGVLSSTDGSGLMQDLSLFPDILNNNDFVNIVNNAAETSISKASTGTTQVTDLRLSTGIRVPGSALNAGAIYDLVAPIITNFMLAFAVFETDDVSENNPFLRMHFFCELWNPYTSSIPLLRNNNNLSYELQITGLPTIAVQVNGGATGPTIDLQDVLGDSSKTDNPLVIELSHDPDDPLEPWLPGMTKNWTGIVSNNPPTPASGSSPYTSTQTQTKDWSAASQTLGGDDGIPITSVARASDPTATPAHQIGIVSVPQNSGNRIVVKLFLVDRTTSPTLRTLLAQVNGIDYEPISVPQFNLVNSSTLAGNDARFGYHFLLKGPHHSNNDPDYNRGRWLFDNDPRNPSPDLSDPAKAAYIPVKDGISAELAPIFPHDLTSDTINIEDSRRLWDRSIINPAESQFSKIWQDAPLFEIPRERILSLASLQHLYFHGERPFRVGNSWGQESKFTNTSNNLLENTLEWFDHYFFSGLSRLDNPNASGFEIRNGFPNPLLIPYKLSNKLEASTAINNWKSLPPNDEDDAKRPAQNLLLTNRFNINSTSVSAWTAILGGLKVNNWPYIDETDDRADQNATVTVVSESRGPLFARFSHSLHETFDAPVAEGAPSAFYRRGARFLRKDTVATNDELRPLAQQIVDRIKSRKIPFRSMEEFLQDPSIAAGLGTGNGSLIEEAIEAVFAPFGIQEWDHSWQVNEVGGSPPIVTDHFSPGFLTQADILTAIGPMLAPRSDTFKIRARCQTLSPFDPDEVVGDATIEALVQRVPDPLDPDNDQINDSIDRKFKIVSVRWLTRDEI